MYMPLFVKYFDFVTIFAYLYAILAERIGLV